MSPHKHEASHEAPEASDFSESSLVATKKLDRLMDDKFDNFGVRFVSFSEYGAGLRNGNFGQEVYFPKYDNREPFDGIGYPRDYEGLPKSNNFTEYLDLAQKFGWPYVAEIQTGWTHIVDRMGKSRYLTHCFRRSYQEAIEQKKTNEEAKKWAVSALYGALRMVLGKNDFGLGYDIKRIESEGLPQQLINDIGDEYANAIAKVFRDPTILEDATIRRKVISTVSRLPLGNNRGGYHLALVFDSGAASDEVTWNRPFWRLLKDSPDEKLNGLLAVISVSNDKQLVNDLRHMSENSGHNAHVVIDAKGKVCYPSK
jgi:hypothetical protein